MPQLLPDKDTWHQADVHQFISEFFEAWLSDEKQKPPRIPVQVLRVLILITVLQSFSVPFSRRCGLVERRNPDLVKRWFSCSSTCLAQFLIFDVLLLDISNGLDDWKHDTKRFRVMIDQTGRVCYSSMARTKFCSRMCWTAIIPIQSSSYSLGHVC